MTTATLAAPAAKNTVWNKSYQETLNTPPAPGTILKALGDEAARLDIETVDGKPPFIFGRVYVPCVVGEAIGWFLQSTEAKNAFGWKCIIMPKSREELLKKYGLDNATIAVKSLRVVRKSQSGKALLCEVAEYAAE